jgi:hypothetical protein
MPPSNIQTDELFKLESPFADNPHSYNRACAYTGFKEYISQNHPTQFDRFNTQGSTLTA